MTRQLASTTTVDREALHDFVRDRHHMVLTTWRTGGGVQSSPVTGGLDAEGRIVISSYPQRAKSANARRHGTASVTVLSDDFDGPYVQVDGTVEVIDMPEAADALVDYFRAISGEHPDWEEYRAAMISQNKCLIRLTPTRWGPVATGGFPPEQT